MAAVFAGGLRPSVGAGRMKAAFAGVSVLSLAQNMLLHSKTAPTSCFIKRWGRRFGRAMQGRLWSPARLYRALVLLAQVLGGLHGDDAAGVVGPGGLRAGGQGDVVGVTV